MAHVQELEGQHSSRVKTAHEFRTWQRDRRVTKKRVPSVLNIYSVVTVWRENVGSQIRSANLRFSLSVTMCTF